MTTLKNGTREETRSGYDLVMTPERDGWMCSVYRTGKQIPLHRTMVKDEAAAAVWFEKKVGKGA